MTSILQQLDQISKLEAEVQTYLIRYSQDAYALNLLTRIRRMHNCVERRRCELMHAGIEC